MKKIIFVLGDVHGEFSVLNAFINKRIRLDMQLRNLAAQNSDNCLDIIILQCGDFAWFWPDCANAGVIKNEVEFARSGRVPIYWCAGNHEDWDALDDLFKDRSGNMAAVDEGVFFCRFGATLDLAPDITVLFAGGAESADKDWRLEEMKKGAPKIWWDQERIGEEDLERLANLPKADWVVSHTAPLAFDLEPQIGGGWIAGGKFYEPSRHQLDFVLEKYHPKEWFFGHYHHHMKGEIAGCSWECLASIGSGSRY